MIEMYGRLERVGRIDLGLGIPFLSSDLSVWANREARLDIFEYLTE